MTDWSELTKIDNREADITIDLSPVIEPNF